MEKVDRIVETLVEVKLKEPDDFLKVKETLTRIGIASLKEKKLYQSCHILHKKGKYYITHFKELFSLDGRTSDFSEEDKARRNTIANLLSEWGLVSLVKPDVVKDPVIDMRKIKVLPFKEKSSWTLVPKYRVGVKRNGNSD